MKPQAKTIYERKDKNDLNQLVLEQVALREDGQWFARTMSIHGDRPLKTWHKIDAPQNLSEYRETGSRALFPKDKDKDKDKAA